MELSTLHYSLGELGKLLSREHFGAAHGGVLRTALWVGGAQIAPVAGGLDEHVQAGVQIGSGDGPDL